jgi:hypothetical protein
MQGLESVLMGYKVVNSYNHIVALNEMYCHPPSFFFSKKLPRGFEASSMQTTLCFDASTAIFRMQQPADMLSTWTEDWCVHVNTGDNKASDNT